MDENVEKFMSELAASLENGTFVKLTLGNYKGPDEHLQKIHIRGIETKKGKRLYFLYRHDARDVAKNYEPKEGVERIVKLLGTEFFAGVLFTTANDFHLTVGRKGKSRLNVAKPTLKVVPPMQHDRKKRQVVDPASLYLNSLGITNEDGTIKSTQQDKWRQINKFVEILAGLVDSSPLKDRTQFSIVDMGSGKGYLTFATYDYFKNVRELDVTVTGVEARPDLAEICNSIAEASDFEGLKFVNDTIDSYEVRNVDVLIALHACNTATDDALFKGIKGQAGLIVAAPCCHKEIRPQIVPPEMLRDILKHGVMLERTAETLTDGIRSLLLEREGYATKLFEFVSVEHTPKNNMLVATRADKQADRGRFQQEIDAIKETYSIKHQQLETLLKSSTDGHR